MIIKVGDYVRRQCWPIGKSYEVARVSKRNIKLLHKGITHTYSLDLFPLPDWVIECHFTHTREDLAMALELAKFIADDSLPSFLSDDVTDYDLDAEVGLVSDWLRAEVIATLRGER